MVTALQRYKFNKWRSYYKIKVDLLYCGTTRTGALERRLSNHNDF